MTTINHLPKILSVVDHRHTARQAWHLAQATMQACSNSYPQWVPNDNNNHNNSEVLVILPWHQVRWEVQTMEWCSLTWTWCCTSSSISNSPNSTVMVTTKDTMVVTRDLELCPPKRIPKPWVHTRQVFHQKLVTLREPVVARPWGSLVLRQVQINPWEWLGRLR